MLNSWKNGMESSLTGRVRKYKTTMNGWYLPLFEAVSNSIYSIEEADQKNGLIEIILCRSPEIIKYKSSEPPPIQDIMIRDNGIGFITKNFESFRCLDSELSLGQGRKGEGRLSWLAYFEKAEVISTHKEENEWKQVSFGFSLEKDGISNISRQIAFGKEFLTSITLLNLQSKFHKSSQKTEVEIAQALVIHFLADFFAGRMPEITVRDENHNIGISLTKIFKHEYKGIRGNSKILIRDQEFNLQHLLCEIDSAKNKVNHRVHWCGQRRQVQDQKLNTLPFLGEGALPVSDNKFYIYIGVLQGTYLDDCLDEKRIKFMFPGEDELNGISTEITRKELEEKTKDSVSIFLDSYLVKAKEYSLSALKRYIENEAPEYRHLLKNHNAEFNNQNFLYMSNELIEEYLHQLERKSRNEIKKKTQKMLHTGKEDLNAIQQQVESLMENISEVNNIDLSRYVVIRKAILDVFEKLLGIQENGKFAREERIHDLIFPMRKNSNDVLPHEHNLWLIDDRLTFHTLLYSDLPMSHCQEDGDRKEPDILAFRSTYLSREGDRNEPLHSATLIEFKRPERGSFTKTDNPIDQLMEYADRLRDGKIRDTITNRSIRLSDDAPIYAYAITDIDDKLESLLKNRGFYPTPDEHAGFYWFNSMTRTYYEVLSFDKVLSDAKKRNRVFFKKLGLV